MDDALVSLVLARLRTVPLPEENAAQVCYQLGWLEALWAVAQALDLPEARALDRLTNVAPAPPQASGTRSGALT